MKKRITKLMSTLLCCVMLLGLFPTAAFAGAIRGGDQPAEYGVTYSYDNKIGRVLGCWEMISNELLLLSYSCTLYFKGSNLC